MPYPVLYESTAQLAEPAAVAIRSMFADGFSDEAIVSMIESVEQATSPISIVHLRGLGGAMARVGNDETAFAHRDKRYLFAAIDVWHDPSEDPAPHNAWAESTWQKVRHEGSGVYVNFLGNEGEGRIREAYPETTYARLREVKRAYDPTNVFHFNQNIRP
jgi:FAD/FMN-containing dehydrogenase